MWLYILIFLIVVFLYYRTTNNYRYHKKMFLYIMVFWAFFIGLGDMLGGYDRYIYGEIFDATVDERFAGVSAYNIINMEGGFQEKGYMFYNYLLSFITANRYIFILISTLLIIGSFYFAFRNYIKENLIYGVILFMGLFVFFTYTYLREVLAICISFLALKAVLERKPIHFLLILILAYSFHHSAVILLPIYFIPLKKWSVNSIIVVALICFVLGVLGVSSIGFSMFSALTGGDMRADMYVKEYDVEGFFRTDYVVEAVFFLSCILTLYKKIDTEKRTLVLLNYSLFFCFILLLFTRSAQGGRLSWYYMIGIICFITEIVHKTRTVWRDGLIVVSFLLFLRIVDGWGIQLSPYKTFLSNGHRNGDYIFTRFEYDYGYDKDKFYRDPWLVW